MFEFPKYTRMIVQGKPIGVDEAFVTLLRTSRSWDKVSSIFTLFNHASLINFELSLKSLHSELKQEEFILDLNYLDNYYFNNVSGILKGICNFDGEVEADFELGKHITYDCLLEDWVKVSKACPWLDLTASFFIDEEGSADKTLLVFSLKVANGTVVKSEEHLTALPYVYREYPQLTLRDLEHFHSFIKKSEFGLFTKNFKWAMNSNCFSSLIYPQ